MYYHQETDMNIQTANMRKSRQTDSGDVRSRLIGMIPVKERSFRLAGIPTVILEGGDDQPVILLHGPGEFAAVWSRVIPDLIATNRVIVPDLPGHGESGTGTGKLDTNRVLEWLDELIDQTCSSPPILIGHLLGGAIGLRYAIKHKNRLDRLVLVDTFGLGPFRPTYKFARAMIGYIVRPTERSQERLFRQCFVDYDGLDRQFETEFDLLKSYALECARSKKQKRALRSLMPAFAMKTIPSEDLERIDVPVSMIWGRHDRQVKLQVAERAAERYGWPLHVIENAADDPAVEAPEAFLRLLGYLFDKDTNNIENRKLSLKGV
jgi:pimeloyl-ACP methyl ester carboxylesterase